MGNGKPKNKKKKKKILQGGKSHNEGGREDGGASQLCFSIRDGEGGRMEVLRNGALRSEIGEGGRMEVFSSTYFLKNQRGI